MEDEIFILIDRYLAGELNTEEKKAFEERVKNDNEFAERVLLYKSLSENLRSRLSGEEQENQLRATLKNISEKEIDGRSAKVVSMKWYYWAAAASVALLVMVWFYTDNQTYPEYSQYAVHGTLALAERGDDSLKHLAEDAFNAKRYEEAVNHFNSLLADDSTNTELQLYKGVSLLELDRYQEAETIFNAIKDVNTVYRDKAFWYLALTALKQKDYPKCQSLLKEIPTDSEDYNKAQELLDQL